MIFIFQLSMDNIIKNTNRGTGAGGKNTNINGNSLEKVVRDTIKKNISSSKLYYESNNKKKFNLETVKFNNKNYLHAPESAFSIFEKKSVHSNKNIDKAHGSIRPDDCLINENDKIINWIECKFQANPGSVGEKLQTFLEKKKNLEMRFPGWNINYCYVITPFIKKNYTWEVKRLEEEKISYLLTDEPDFEYKLINLIK